MVRCEIMLTWDTSLAGEIYRLAGPDMAERRLRDQLEVRTSKLWSYSRGRTRHSARQPDRSIGQGIISTGNLFARSVRSVRGSLNTCHTPGAASDSVKRDYCVVIIINPSYVSIFLSNADPGPCKNCWEDNVYIQKVERGQIMNNY